MNSVSCSGFKTNLQCKVKCFCVPRMQLLLRFACLVKAKVFPLGQISPNYFSWIADAMYPRCSFFDSAAELSLQMGSKLFVKLQSKDRTQETRP